MVLRFTELPVIHFFIFSDKKDGDKDSKDDKKKEKKESTANKDQVKEIAQDSNGSGPSNLRDVFPKALPTSDAVRLKCREMICNAIKHLGGILLAIKCAVQFKEFLIQLLFAVWYSNLIS